MEKIIQELVGWYGTLAVLLAYALIGFNVLSTESLFYLTLNFTGALGLFFIALKKKIYLISAFYLIWAIIGLIYFFR